MDTPDNDEEFQARAALLNQQLLEATQPMGLYLRNTYMTPESEGSTRVLVYVEFVLGDVAFTDRVQNPEKARQDDETRLALAEAELVDLDAEVMRDRWEQWSKREHLKGGGDADDDPTDAGRDD